MEQGDCMDNSEGEIMEDFPYVFVLLWDIKTKEDLKEAYLQKKSETRLMENTMRRYPDLMFKEWWRKYNEDFGT
jgi:hypothetical protein